jgi:Zn-dependent M16 (insulinase) family peptidase
MKPGLFFTMSIFFLLYSLCGLAQKNSEQTLSTLKEGQKLNGFSAAALYLNDAGQPMGGRFIHDKTGFILDLLQIESVPQTYIWVNSLPLSDKGEPHTQEHLLITKGNKGRTLNTSEGMSLAFSNAFTNQTYTAYNFNTAAGGDVFYKLFEEYLDALLHPDYTDEEVHREVCNWGVVEDAATKELKIEEKGSVYNEMKTSMNNPFAQAYINMAKLLYGKAHPLAYNAGGNPDDIRMLDAAAIKQFHELNYHLGNMGAITSLPKTMPLAAVLKATDAILNRLQPTPEQKSFNNIIPAPGGAPEGTVQLVEYPSTNEQDPGLMLFAFPATLTLSATEELILTNFLNIFAGDASTNLYKKFIDGKTKEIDLDAQGLFAQVDNNAGQPVYIGITDVNAANLTKQKAAMAAQKMMEELNRVASFPDGSPDLKAFNQRFKNSLTDYKRSLAKLTNTPPKFGFRDTYENWYQQLNELTKINSFKKSIILTPQFKEIDALLATGKNFWSDYLNKWRLTTALPYVMISKANTKLMATQDSAAKGRANAEIVVLKAKYNVTGDQEAIRKYKEEYDANTATLENAAQSTTVPFIDHPPLSLDDQLNFKTTLLANKIPMTAATFNNMTSSTTGLALRLDDVPADKLVYLAMLPELLTQTGIIKNGKPIFYEDMMQLQRQQILSLTCNYSINYKTGRAELLVKGAGNTVNESKSALQWMNDVLQNPYWNMQNISRIRDLVNQVLSSKRKTMQGAEEGWVNDPAAAYRVQDKPLLLATSSFLTAAHNIHRLRWMLIDAGNTENRNAAAAYFDVLGTAKGSRDNLKLLLAKLQGLNTIAVVMEEPLQHILSASGQLNAAAKKTIAEAAKDLDQVLNDVPEESLTADWKYLCMQMKHDLLQTPEKTLADLNELRTLILHAANARMFITSSGSTKLALRNSIETLLAGLSAAPVNKVNYTNKRIVEERLKQRLGTSENPVYVGLINPNSSTGVFINAYRLITYADTSREKLLQFLAAQLFAGGGKQSVYTKTTGAGLSYSTGVGCSPSSGSFRYYAERTPLLPQTLSYVIDEIKKTPNDPAMSEYIFSLAVSANRSSAEYEARGEAMAADITDGLTPLVVSNFRKAIIRLRKMPGLMNEVYKRKDAVYEKILPGYGAKMKTIPGVNNFVIGAEKQMTAYETYLQSKDGADTKLYRVYPRDYWMVLE